MTVPAVTPTHSSKFAKLVTSDGRAAGFCWGGRPRCIRDLPRPHILRTREPVVTDAIKTCQHRTERGADICGAQVYVRKIPRLTRDEAVTWFVCEVTPEHVKRLSQEPMLFLEIMTILGCVLPGVELDITLDVAAD